MNNPSRLPPSASGSAPALVLRNVCYNVPGGLGRPSRQLLGGIDFSLAAGECCVLLGPNGAGKTTTLKMAVGLLRPSSGFAALFGRPSHTPAARTVLGYAPERTTYPLALTARELVCTHGQLAGLDRHAAERRAADCLARVGLTAEAQRKLATFSKGMRQRAGLAQALVARPRLLVLDEPFSGLDPAGRIAIRQLLAEENARGVTLLLCTHVVADVAELCQRFIVLGQGKVRLDAASETLAGDHTRATPVEVRCTPLPTDVRQAASALAEDHVHHAQAEHFRFADGAQANAAVDLIRAAGGRILALTPRAPALDTLLLEALQP